MGVFDNVKKVKQRRKLQSSIRELNEAIEAEKKKLGIDLCAFLFNNETKPIDMENMKLAPIYHAYLDDVSEYKKDEKLKEVEAIEEKQDDDTQTITMGDRIKLTKLSAEIIYIDREIRIRQEIFGMQVFEELGMIDDVKKRAEEEKENSDFADEKVDELTNETKQQNELSSVLQCCIAAVSVILRRKQIMERALDDFLSGEAVDVDSQKEAKIQIAAEKPTATETAETAAGEATVTDTETATTKTLNELYSVDLQQ